MYTGCVGDELPDGSPGPRDWIGEAWRSGVAELRHFWSTTLAFSLHPVDFARRWRSGDDRALNPIGFLGTSAIFVGAIRQVAFRILGGNAPDSLVAAIASALGPYAHYAVLAIICHLVMRIGARQRAGVLDSVAFSLYAGGGPAALAECALWIIVAPLSLVLPAGSSQWLISIGLGVAFSVFCTSFSASLSILHEARPGQMFLALAVAFPLVGLFFGQVHPPGQYGMHWVLILWGPHGQFAPRLGLGL